MLHSVHSIQSMNMLSELPDDNWICLTIDKVVDQAGRPILELHRKLWILRSSNENRR